MKKSSFISTVTSTIDTTPSQNGAFQKCSSNRWNLKTPVLHFSFDEKHFENGAFRNRRCHDNHVLSLAEFFSPKKPVMLRF